MEITVLCNCFSRSNQVISKVEVFLDQNVHRHTQFSLRPITSEFVLKQLKAMANTTATGLDGFSVKILKLAAPAIIAPITKICNLSLATGTFPDKWNEGKVTHFTRRAKRRLG